mgnify:CR=1 FL=1
MKKDVLILILVFSITILTSVVMAEEARLIGKIINIDDDDISNKLSNFSIVEVRAIPPSGDLLPLESWGRYRKEDIGDESYFSAYLDGFLYDRSSDKELSGSQLSKVLRSDRKIQYIGWDGEGTFNLMLAEGYELALKSIDADGNKIYLELSKDGAVVDSKVIQPLKPGFTIADKTYYYKRDVGTAKDIVTIAVHIQTLVGWEGGSLAVADGVWQISDTIIRSTPQKGDLIYHDDFGTGIWRIGPDGSGKVQLSDHGWFAEYSPDNSMIAFSDFYDKGIWIMDADGTDQQQLTTSGSAPTWSPDGSQIAYFTGGTVAADRRLWIMDANGSNAHQLSDNPGSFPKWSPDGDSIAYHGESNNGIWIIDPDGSNELQLFNNGGYPTWSPDGDLIAYVSLSDWKIWVMNLDGSYNFPLTDHKGINPTWSGDGMQIAYEDLESDKGIWTVNINGSGDEKISDDGHSPDWSNQEHEEVDCCSMISPITLDFSGLSGTPSVIKGVLFTVIWKDVLIQDGSLCCLGSEQYGGIWHNATAKMDFQMLPCKVCAIAAKVDGRGPEAKLEGKLLGGGSVAATTHDEKTLTIKAPVGSSFVSANVSGQEAVWMAIRLE